MDASMSLSAAGIEDTMTKTASFSSTSSSSSSCGILLVAAADDWPESGRPQQPRKNTVERMEMKTCRPRGERERENPLKVIKSVRPEVLLTGAQLRQVPARPSIGGPVARRGSLEPQKNVPIHPTLRHLLLLH